MEHIKIDNFIQENPNIDFPSFESLDNKSCESIRLMLLERLKLDSSISDLLLVKAVDDFGEIYDASECNKDALDLKEVLLSLGETCPEYVYINWYRYDDIDKMKFSDLVNYFDDIWYPDVDDIDVFDESLNWVLSITHYGQVKFLKFR